MTDQELARIWASLPDPLRMETTDGQWFLDVARAVEREAYEKAAQACDEVARCAVQEVRMYGAFDCASAVRALAGSQA